MLEDDHSIVWAITGRYYGYPACCIAHFIQRSREISATMKIPVLTAAQQSVLDGHGFIPCPRCAADVMADLYGSWYLSILIKDRHCSHYYPTENISASKDISRNVQELWDEYQQMLEQVPVQRLPNYVKGGDHARSQNDAETG